MFVPPYHLIEPLIRTVHSPNGGSDGVVMPTELFRFLLRCALEGCDFDEAQYQRCNPDVADAVERRELASGREHFLGKGYFEDRVGAVPVHEAWYLFAQPRCRGGKAGGISGVRGSALPRDRRLGMARAKSRVRQRCQSLERATRLAGKNVNMPRVLECPKTRLKDVIRIADQRLGNPRRDREY